MNGVDREQIDMTGTAGTRDRRVGLESLGIFLIFYM